ncbi:hypothetical protein GCM10023092_09470 [Rurimicrobium arvi]|uniref:Uncharacterized protein n=1 Tax=Rurimicrobium arvi TaxID=2049916 RepID=A0ABP8MK62_9BACT
MHKSRMVFLRASGNRYKSPADNDITTTYNFTDTDRVFMDACHRSDTGLPAGTEQSPQLQSYA